MGKGAIYASLPNFSEGTRHQLALVLSDPEQGKYCVTGMAYLNLSEETPMFPESLREAGRPQACCLSPYHHTPQFASATLASSSPLHQQRQFQSCPPNLSLINTFMEAEISLSQPLLKTQVLREDISLSPVPSLFLILTTGQQQVVLPTQPAFVSCEK